VNGGHRQNHNFDGANPHLTVREIQEILSMLHGSVAHIRDAGYVNRIDVWVPHELRNRNLQQFGCDLLLEKNKEHFFF